MAILDTFIDIQNDVRSRLQETTASLWTAADIKLWINLALREFAELTGYFKTNVSAAVTTGTGSYALDSGGFAITRWIDQLGVRQVVYNNNEIDEVLEKDLPLQRSITTNGTVNQWYLESKTIELFPPPDATKTLKVYAYQYPAELSADANTSGLPINRNEILVYGAMCRALEKDGHPDSAYFRRLFYEGVAAFNTLLEERVSRHRDLGLHIDSHYYRNLRFGK